MCYLVTHKGLGETQVLEDYPDKGAAMAAASKATLDGFTDVRVWGLMHSMKTEPMVVITDHFKGGQ